MQLKYFIWHLKFLELTHYTQRYIPDIQQAVRRNSTNLSLLMFELCSLLCLKLNSLNFAIARAQKKKCNAFQNSS